MTSKSAKSGETIYALQNKIAKNEVELTATVSTDGIVTDASASALDGEGRSVCLGAD